MFSGAVRITDLSDFVAPSQACVVALDANNKLALDADAGVQLQPRASAAPALAAAFPQAGAAGAGAPGGPVKLSLHDCLACAGCVTSAETVLLEHQSAGELLARLADPARVVVVSLAPQAVAALAAAHGLPPRECALQLAGFFRALGARAVLDVSWARDVALAEAAAEFAARFRARAAAAAGGAERPMDFDSSGAAAAADADARGADHPDAAAPGGAFDHYAPGPLPMLASACPGWVCYAEKTHGEVLPHISGVKSPQAVAGTAVKRAWAAAAGVSSESVYHAAVMPCYDKKLEAARDDLQTEGGAPETDCVLATTEVLELLAARGADLRALPPAPLDAPPFGGAAAADEAAAGRTAGRAGGAGGYLEHVFRAAALELFGITIPPGPLPLTRGRNPDLRECVLEVGGRPALRFAAAYGFRNIQRVVRAVKSGKSPYDYVEVMACPAGCLNGGGQPRSEPGEPPGAALARAEAAYNDPDWREERSAGASPAAAGAYAEWVRGPPGSAPARALLHTRYHARGKAAAATVAALGDW
jgi:iron only hydrogenase large subunit-like protein